METSTSKRLVSIDALRGFDMVWIAGGATLITNFDKTVDSGFSNTLAQQMHHAQWIGFTFMDIIMPLFLFITGCSMVFSFQKRLGKDGKLKVYSHVVKRFAILWILGMIYQGNLLTFDWSQIDFFSNTLQAIAIGYLGASMILLIKQTKWQIVLTSALLVIYWSIMNMIPGFEATVEGNIAIYIDKLVYPNHMGNPEYSWVLSSIGFVVTVMLGVFSGKILTSHTWKALDKLKYLVIIGVGLSIAGHLLTLNEPCIKKIWNSSFTLISGGYSTLLLAMFYGIIDVAGYTKWAQPFVMLGKNALLVYIVFAYNRFINLGEIANRFLFGTEQFVGAWYPVVLSCMTLVCLWGVFYFLNAKKVFVKI